MYALDNHFAGRFRRTGPLTHNVLAGFDYQRHATSSNYKFNLWLPAL